MLKQGLDPAVKSFRANYHLSMPEEQAQATSLEFVTFLKVSKVWDRIMLDALKFKIKQERVPRNLKTGIHTTNYFWKYLPLKTKED